MLAHLKTWLFSLAVAGLVAVAFEPPSAHAQNSNIEALRTEAESARAFAEKRRAVADSWEEKADKARREAEEATHRRDREGWLDDARLYEERAAAADIDADKAEAAAARSEARLVEALKNLERPAPAENAQQVPQQDDAGDQADLEPISLEKTIGTWRIEETDSNFVIVQEEPGSEIHGYRLEAHTGSRIWKGTYTPFKEADARRMQDARVVLKYSPGADEMNPDIPDWARKKVEGALEWEIELDDAGHCTFQYLSGSLYPGEVKWNTENTGAPVRITGRGEPRPITLERIYDFELDMVGRPSLVVTIGGNHDPFLQPIEGLTKRQRFFVRVSLPKAMAEEMGDSIEVSVRGLSSGEEDTITLTAGGASSAKAGVNYTHTQPATIADSNDMREQDRRLKFLSWSWLTDRTWAFGVAFWSLVTGDGWDWQTGNVTAGARLDLDVPNNEFVEFRFGDVFEVIPVHDSWVQRSNARYAAAAERLKFMLETGQHITGVGEDVGRIGLQIVRKMAGQERKKPDPRTTKARLQMLENLRSMVTSDHLTDIHKHELFKRYIAKGSGLVFSTPKALDDVHQETIQSIWYGEKQRPGTTLGSDMLKGFGEGLTGADLSSKIPKAYENIDWVSEGEAFFAKEALRDATSSIKDQAVDELATALVFGLYDGVVMTSGAGQVYLIGTASLGAVGDAFGIEVLGDGARDHFGKKASSLDVAMAATGLGSGLILHYGGGTAWSRFSDRNIGVQFGGKGFPVKFRMNRLGAPSKSKRVFRGETKPYEHPLSLKPTQLGQVKLTAPQKQSAVAQVAAAPGSGGARKKYDPAVDRFIQDVETVDAFYGGDGDIVDALDDRVAKPQCFETCNLRADTYVHEKNGMGPKSDVEAFVQMKRADLLDEHGLHDGKNVLQEGVPNELSREFNNLNNVEVIEIPATANRAMGIHEIDNMKKVVGADDVKVVLATGPMDRVEAARKSGDKIVYHAVVIHKVKRGADDVITHVQFFDPAIGRIVEMEACRFNRRLAKHGSYGNTTLYFTPKPKSIFQTKKFRPADLPGDQMADAGQASAPGSGGKKKIKVEEFDPTPIEVDEFDDLPPARMTVDEAVDHFYPDKKKAPPLNVVQTDVHDDLMNGAPWLQPARGGAAFSKEGLGTVYGNSESDVVLRINEDFARDHIVWVKDRQGRGLNPLYYPEGLNPDGTGIGRHRTYVPREHLEYLDVSQPGPPEWRTYPSREG
ncbi:hypothetical protein [Nitratireductor sp. XY-223]|uniref:hypothetical protein n=1 Tax=Nitratireductor sp. XY-223 TaxID=2561926 RepID=UPI0010AB270E|nr:hypothetical protein [Nitratireductor sp. XY-223]